MASLSSNIFLVIAVTSIATYLSRFLGVLSSEKIDENSKIFRRDAPIKKDSAITSCPGNA